jgi:hypothetical protein
MNAYDIPPTEAELAAEGDAFVKWARNMPPEPKPKRERKLDTTPQASIDQQIAAAIAAERALVMDVMAQVVGEIQSRLKTRLKNLETEITNLRTELNVERRVNERIVRIEQSHQREQRHAINGHA